MSYTFISSPHINMFHCMNTLHWHVHFSSLPLSTSCSASELNGGSWQVTKVVKPDELGRPNEWLQEQMRKLELSPQKGENSHTPLVHTRHLQQLDYAWGALYHRTAECSICTGPHILTVWALHHTSVWLCAFLHCSLHKVTPICVHSYVTIMTVVMCVSFYRWWKCCREASGSWTGKIKSRETSTITADESIWWVVPLMINHTKPNVLCICYVWTSSYYYCINMK